MDLDLSDWRERIDGIDAKLVELLNQRCHCAIAVGRYKARHQRAVCDPDRESAVLSHVERINQGPLGAAALRRIFEHIVAEMRAIQDEERQTPAC